MDDLRHRLQAALGDAYHIDRELPGGGMSRLFVATDRALDRAVVVKVLPPELLSEVSTARFQREMSLTAQLQHPHVVPVLSAGARDHLLYYLTPYITGETLRDRLRREQRLPVPDAVRILSQVADALDYAHAHHVVHRDVKPENILLPGDHAVLADFGIARAVEIGRAADGGLRVTATGTSIGTPGYMAPEQIAGESDVDGRADVYALAVVGYEMLTGARPFVGATARAVLAAQMAEHPTPITAERPEVMPALADVITGALSADPAHRPATAGEFGRRIAATQASGPVLSAVRPPRARTIAYGGLAAAAAILMVAGWLGWRRSHGPGSPVSLSTVAIMPFSVTGPAQHGYLGAGMVDLLSTTLDGAGDLHTADPRTILAAARAVSGPLDIDGAGAIATHAGAALFVLGSVFNVGQQLRITAGLYDARALRRIASASVDGDTTDVLRLVDRLGAQLLAERHSGPGARITQLASATTTSLPALKAYLEGEAALRGNRFQDAADAFQRAVAIDTSFALAYYRLSIAGEWLVRTDLSELGATRALRFSDRLSSHDRQLLTGLDATRSGDTPRGERIYRSIVGTYPDDVEAWLQLGEILFHNGPAVGLPLTDAYEPFARVLTLDPSSAPPLVHLARVAASTGSRAGVDSFAQRSVARSPSGSRTLEMRALTMAVDGDSTSLRKLAAESGHTEDLEVFIAGWSVALYSHRVDLARVLMAELTKETRPVDVRVRAHCTLAAFDVVEGHVRAAAAELARAVPLAPDAALEYSAVIALLPFRSLAADSARALQRRLTLWTPMRPSGGKVESILFDGDDGIHPLIRGYLLGLAAAAGGDTSAASSVAAAVPRLADAPARDQLAQHYQGAIRAELAWPNRPASALAPLTFRDDGYYEWFLASPFWSEGRQRYRRAQSLVANGQDTAAVRWFSSFEATSSDDLMYLPPSELERARLYERLGQPAQAAAHYRRFLRYWSDPDPEFLPLVQDAQRRLAALGGA